MELLPKHYKLLTRIADFYHDRFMENTRGMDYLANRRGITRAEIYEHFKIGIGDGSLIKAMPQDETRELLKELGMLTSRSREFFYGYVVFPIFSADGTCVNMYGRRIKAGPGVEPHLYLPIPNRGIFNWQAFTNSREIILTRSIIDSLSLIQLGYNEAVPICGREGLTERHLELFETYRSKKVYLAIDNNEEGERRAKEIAERLKDFGIPCLRVRLPVSVDVNDYLKLGYSRENFDLLLKEAEPIEVGIKGGRIKIDEDVISFKFDARGYEARPIRFDPGLKVKIKAVSDGIFHIDTIDLYTHRSRKSFVSECMRLFKTQRPLIEKDLCRIIERLEEIRDSRIEEEKNLRSMRYQRMRDSMP